MSTTDSGAVLVPGPWEHRFVTANGTRLHVAEAGEGPLVLLVHGFPQFWWTWRRALPAIADAGFRVAALDLRGHGASDKPPTGYDAATMAADLASLVRSLGSTDATIVGHGLGAWLAWAMPQLHPEVTRAVGALAMPHPRLLTWPSLSWRFARRGWAGRAPAWGVAGRTPATLRLAEPAVLESSLHAWAAPGSTWPSTEVVSRYSSALSLPFAARSATEAHRWLATASLRPSGRALLTRVAQPVDVPVVHLHGQDDPLLSAARAERSAGLTRAGYEWHLLPRVGHFVQEEAPAATVELLVDWLRRRAARPQAAQRPVPTGTLADAAVASTGRSSSSVSA